jgi:CRP-like cAMP-binding protein
MDKLFAKLNDVARISDELRQHLYNIVTDKAVKKCKLLVKAGEVCRNIYFLEAGLVVIYRESENGERTVTWILEAGDFLILPDSFSGGGRTAFNVLVLEDTTTWYTNYDQLVDVCEKTEFYTHYTRIEGFYRDLEAKFKPLTSKERFDLLWDTRRDLFRRVKKKFLASYIGITEATFDAYRNAKP